MDFTPEQMAQMVSMDPTLSDQQRAIILSELSQASNAGLSMLTPGRLYSVGLGALAGWLVGKLVSGDSKGGLIGSVIGGGMGLFGGNSDGRPPGFSLDHTNFIW